MTEFGLAVAMVAPYYNLAFVLIVLYLFIQLFKTAQENPDVYITPWIYLFMAVVVFVIEEIITVLRAIGMIAIERSLNGFFELAIIILFLYAILLQTKYVHTVFTHPATPAPLPTQTASKKKR